MWVSRKYSLLIKFYSNNSNKVSITSEKNELNLSANVVIKS